MTKMHVMPFLFKFGNEYVARSLIKNRSFIVNTKQTFREIQ